MGRFETGSVEKGILQKWAGMNPALAVVEKNIKNAV